MIEGISHNLPISDTVCSTNDMDSVMSSRQATTLQTLKNQEDKIAQKQKLNDKN